MDPQPPTAALDPVVLAMLRCPRTGRPLHAEIHQGRSVLSTDDGRATYQIVDGIPILLPEPDPQTEARTQARTSNPG